jgi:hypothetical protein
MSLNPRLRKCPTGHDRTPRQVDCGLARGGVAPRPNSKMDAERWSQIITSRLQPVYLEIRATYTSRRIPTSSPPIKAQHPFHRAIETSTSPPKAPPKLKTKLPQKPEGSLATGSISATAHGHPPPTLSNSWPILASERSAKPIKQRQAAQTQPHWQCLVR